MPVVRLDTKRIRGIGWACKHSSRQALEKAILAMLPDMKAGADVNAVLRSSVPPAEIDPEVTLLVPERDVADPEFSIVIPSLNEELTMADFVTWCQEGLKKAGVRGEILIIDSGKDSRGRDRTRARRASFEDTEAWPGPGLSRCAALHSRPIHPDG